MTRSSTSFLSTAASFVLAFSLFSPLAAHAQYAPIQDPVLMQRYQSGVPMFYTTSVGVATNNMAQYNWPTYSNAYMPQYSYQRPVVSYYQYQPQFQFQQPRQQQYQYQYQPYQYAPQMQYQYQYASNAYAQDPYSTGFAYGGPYAYGGMPTGDTVPWLGGEMCNWAGYGRSPCAFDPQQPVYDAWTGTYY